MRTAAIACAQGFKRFTMNFLTPNTLPNALQKSMTQLDLGNDQRLFRTGDPARLMYVVASGRLQLLRSTMDDKLTVLQLAGPGTLLGEESLWSDYHGGSAIAKVTSRILAYPAAEALRAIHRYAALSDDFFLRLERRVKALETNLEVRGIKTSHQRVLRYLQRLAHVVDDETLVHIDRPLKEIASEVDITAETLSRALLRLERTGEIMRRNGDIVLLSNPPYVA